MEHHWISELRCVSFLGSHTRIGQRKIKQRMTHTRRWIGEVALSYGRRYGFFYRFGAVTAQPIILWILSNAVITDEISYIVICSDRTCRPSHKVIEYQHTQTQTQFIGPTEWQRWKDFTHKWLVPSTPLLILFCVFIIIIKKMSALLLQFIFFLPHSLVNGWCMCVNVFSCGTYQVCTHFE